MQRPKYDDAYRTFEQTVLSKQDMANAWYNWAYAAKQTGRLSEAVQYLNQAVTLVPTTSGDYDKANQELTTWKQELDEAIKKQQAAAVTPTPTKAPESLKAPQAMPTVSKEEKVNVPAADLEPPAISPVPTVSEKPTAKPSVAKTATPSAVTQP